MKIQNNEFDATPEEVYAVDFLERHGDVLGHNFQVGTAIDEAALWMTIFLEENYDWDDLIKKIKSPRFLDWT